MFDWNDSELRVIPGPIFPYYYSIHHLRMDPVLLCQLEDKLSIKVPHNLRRTRIDARVYARLFLPQDDRVVFYVLVVKNIMQHRTSLKRPLGERNRKSSFSSYASEEILT